MPSWSTPDPMAWAKRPKRPAHADSSLAPLLQCTIATASPAGVVTTSISSWTCSSGCSRTTIAKALVPTDTLPVRLATELVATIPVPASPSGGQNGTPAFRAPVGSSSAAPSAVRSPAAAPAGSTSGSSFSSLRPGTRASMSGSTMASIRWS